MTLCIAEKINSTVILASDSRITANMGYSDIAIKVMPIPISITSPPESSTGKKEQLYCTSLGFAFSGAFAAQNAIKDFLAIALQQLQFIPTLGELTFERICDYVMDLYRYVFIKFSTELKNDGIDFFLCGTCPQTKIVKLAKFFIYDENVIDDKPEPKYSIYESNSDFPLAIGAGVDKFQVEYKKLDTLLSPMRAINALKNVIDDINIPCVGGNIQYGESSPNRPFLIKGIVVTEFHNNDSLNTLIVPKIPKLNRFCLGGIDVSGDIFSEKPGLYMMGEFIKPFLK